MSAIADPWLGEVAQPHKSGGRPAKGHVGRQRKVHCERCGFIAYASRGALQRSGLPSCGCGEPMTLANLRDRAAVEWDALEAELRSYGRETFNSAMRELGEPVERESGGEWAHWRRSASLRRSRVPPIHRGRLLPRARIRPARDRRSA